MKFWWWDDAVAQANELARGTRIRHRVFGYFGVWVVEPVIQVAEVCS